jgi:hypothetical protein
VRICLWILAEVAVIAADIPEGKQYDKPEDILTWPVPAGG